MSKQARKIYVAHSTGFDFRGELYRPLREGFSDLEFFFPHEAANEEVNSREVIAESDLFLAEVSWPSMGTGVEIGRAEAAEVPIVFIHRKGQLGSSSLKFVKGEFLEYEKLEDVLGRLREIIDKLIGGL